VGLPDASDAELMQWAATNGYIVLTADLDFGAILAATRDARPSVVQIRAMFRHPAQSAVPSSQRSDKRDRSCWKVRSYRLMPPGPLSAPCPKMSRRRPPAAACASCPPPRDPLASPVQKTARGRRLIAAVVSPPNPVPRHVGGPPTPPRRCAGL